MINEKHYNDAEYTRTISENKTEKTVTHLFANTNANRAESLVIKYDILKNDIVIQEIILKNICDTLNNRWGEKSTQ